MANDLIVGTLKTLLTVDSATYESGMRQASTTANKFTGDTKALKAEMGGFDDLAGKVTKALTAAFTVTAIVGLGKQVVDFASHLEDLSSKTGISTTGLQKLQLAFEQSGVSLDVVTRSVGELGARLVGDKGAQKLLKDLGFNLQELKRMTPEEMFTKVADAVGNIQNKSEQLYASKTLFGKGGVELLAGLDGHLQSTTDHFEAMGLIIDEQTIKAADDFGDQMGLIGKQLLAILANAIGPMLPALSALANAFSAVANVIGPILGVVLKGVTIGIMGVYSAIADMLGFLAEAAQKIPLVGKHMEFMGDAAAWLHKSAEGAAVMMGQLVTGTDKVATSTTQRATPALLGLGNEAEKTGDKIHETSKHVEELNEHLEVFYATVGQDILLQNAKAHIAEFELPFKDLQKTIPETMQYLGNYMGLWNEMTVSVSASAKDMQQQTTGAFQGLANGVTSGLKNLWQGMSGGQGFAGLMNKLGDSIVKGFGNIISGGLTSVINMGVNLAVQGVAKIGKLIGGLFQSEETKKVNKPRDAFFNQFGGYDGLARDLTQAFIDRGNEDAGNAASNLIQNLYNADTESSFHSAEDDIANIFSSIGRRVQVMDQGGFGTVTQPTMFLAGVNAPEQFAFSGEGKTFGGGSDMAGVIKEVRGLRRELPRTLGLVFKDAMAGV